MISCLPFVHEEKIPTAGVLAFYRCFSAQEIIWMVRWNSECVIEINYKTKVTGTDCAYCCVLLRSTHICHCMARKNCSAQKYEQIHIYVMVKIKVILWKLVTYPTANSQKIFWHIVTHLWQGWFFHKTYTYMYVHQSILSHILANSSVLRPVHPSHVYLSVITIFTWLF